MPAARCLPQSIGLWLAPFMAKNTLPRQMLPLDLVLARFLSARSPSLTPRRARGYAELAELLVEYLGRYRLRELPCDPAFGAVPGTIDAELLGQLHRDQRAAIDALLELADDFGDRYLAPLDVERSTIRLSEVMIRELGRWLRTVRLAPVAAERGRAPHLSLVKQADAAAPKARRGRRSARPHTAAQPQA